MRLFLSVAVLACTSVAEAQPIGDDAAMRAGVELRRAHRDEEALAQFVRVFEQTRRPVARAQMGLAEQALGRWIEAETNLRAALEATADPWIARNRGTLAGALSVIEQHVGSLWIDGGVAGAEVWVDDHRVATMPLSAPIRVVAGTLSVQVRAPGFESVHRSVVVAGGGEAREIIHLSRGAGAGGRLADADSGSSDRGPQSFAPGRVGGTQRALGWASLVGGVVGLGIGVGGALAREGAVQDYNGQANCPGRLSPSQPPDCQTLVENVETMDVLSTVSLVAGGALTITSVILLATAPSRPSATESRMRVVGIAGPGMVGAQCIGQF
jgi:hypothetical protein